MKNRTLLTAGIGLIATIIFMANTASATPPNVSACSFSSSEIESSDVPKQLEDFKTIQSTITVSGLDPYIFDVDVFVDITHIWNADLDISLVSPSGTEVFLASDLGDAYDDIFAGTTFDDQSPIAATDYPYEDDVAAPHVIPEGALWGFFGEDPNGTWTLKVYDDLDGDSGKINDWSLVFSTCDKGTISKKDSQTVENTEDQFITNGSPIKSNITISQLEGVTCEVELYLKIEHPFNTDLDVYLTSPSGTKTPLTTESGGHKVNGFFGTVFSDKANAFPVNDFPFVNGEPATIVIPEGAFATYIGEDPNGTWTLDINDNAPGDDGNLREWNLTVTSCTLDKDKDSVIDELDNCIDDPNKEQEDTDRDGAGNACDLCPFDSAKLTPGVCGCGESDEDRNGNGTPDCNDGGPNPTPTQTPSPTPELETSATSEAILRIAEIESALQPIKYAKNRKGKRRGKRALRVIRGQLSALDNFVQSEARDITFASNNTLSLTIGTILKADNQVKNLITKFNGRKRTYNRLKRSTLRTLMMIRSGFGN